MEEREKEQITKQGVGEKQGRKKGRRKRKRNKPPEIEDRVLKVAMEAFGEEMVQYLGQEGKVLRAVPTEQVHLEVRKMLEDFNFEMEDKTWRHYEFESDRLSVEDLRRFREYEAYLSLTQAVPVITTVLCSADVKEALSSMVQGINTYRVEVVQMKQRDADQELKNIWGIIDRAEKLSKEQIIPIILLPLMGGKTSIFDRIQQGFQILKQVQDQFEEQEIKKIQAMLYAFACKFLKEEDWAKIKEEIGMTVLGQMLVNDGIEKGIIALIHFGKRFDISGQDIVKNVKKEFSLSQDQAEGYVEKYWGD